MFLRRDSMQILWLKSHYFRAFGDSPSIRFSDNLTIFYGGNGSGKSSLAEALEWLFFGYTRRRRKGDQYSKTEYRGSYVHSGCPTGETPYVEAAVIFPDGSEHILKRTIVVDSNGNLVDDDSKLSSDGNLIQDFSDVGIVYNEAHCPVVVQHGIQDFIHTRPIDRYRSISEALGVADLVSFKDFLEKAKNRYRKELPDRVSQAQSSMRQLTTALRIIGLPEVATRWMRGEIDDPGDSNLIQSKARELSGSAAQDTETLLQDVRLRQAAEINKVFDISPYRPNPIPTTLFSNAELALTKVKESLGHLFLIASDLSGISASTHLDTQLKLWKLGLKFLKETDGIPKEGIPTSLCPFCGEPTIDKPVIDAIQSSIEGNQNLATKQNEFTNKVDSIIMRLDEIIGSLNQLSFQAMDDQEQQRLKSMFIRHQSQLGTSKK